MLNWRQSTENTEVELYSELTLWKMIQDLTQYSLNKDIQHLKWLQPKLWISSPDCQVAMDQQRTQHLPIPKHLLMPKYFFKKIYFQNAENSKIGISGHLDSFTSTQVAKIMVQYGRPSRSSEQEFCTIIFWHDFCGKSNLRKSYWNMAGIKFKNGNVSLCIVKKDFSHLCMWMT